MDTAEFPRRPTTLAWVGWGALVCLVVAAADSLLALIGTALLGTAGGLAARIEITSELAASLFLSQGGLRFIGLAAMLATTVVGHRLLPPPGWRRWVGLALLATGATAVGWFVFAQLFCEFMRQFGLEARYGKYCGRDGLPQGSVPLLLARQAQYALLLVGLYEFALRSRRAAEALHEAGLRQLDLERERAAARAQLLQAQIEPHFLFNSLANLRRLVRTDPDAAAAMLAALLRYLQEALPRLRETGSTLGQEVELVRAYLDVQRVRMGERLRFEVSVPEALAATPVPPMLLLTLVENALKHGLQPLAEGGRIEVEARRDGGVLTLTVGDDGRGMGEGIGHGTGLANIRARLRALYGAAASLSLQVNQPRGVRATVTLPGAAA